MSDERTNGTGPQDNELEREIRSQRKFDLAEGIGRSGGADLLKGASPVSRKRQADLELKHYLQRHVVDVEGILETVLARRVVESGSLLEKGYEQPLESLRLVIDRLLGSEVALREFVREIDAEWGRVNQERPCFERAGLPPAPNDPYTIASVRAKLANLMTGLAGA